MSDNIRRADAMGAVQDHFNDDGFKGYDDGQKMMDRIKAIPSADTSQNLSKPNNYCEVDLISRADAIEAVHDACNYCDTCDLKDIGCSQILSLKEVPSADAVDCTDFIEWLVDRVLDETIWENNSVAYGEIICRKLEKLGVLEATEEPSYYIRHIENNTKESDLVYRPSADAVHGEWIFNPTDAIDLMFAKPKCSKCGFESSDGGNFCPNCGARMKGEVEK